MGLTKCGRTKLIQLFTTMLKQADITCSGGICIRGCSLLCPPYEDNGAVFVIIDIPQDKCVSCGIVDNETVFQGYTLSDGTTALWEGTLNNQTKPANAGMLLKIQLTFGDL